MSIFLQKIPGKRKNRNYFRDGNHINPRFSVTLIPAEKNLGTTEEQISRNKLDERLDTYFDFGLVFIWHVHSQLTSI